MIRRRSAALAVLLPVAAALLGGCGEDGASRPSTASTAEGWTSYVPLTGVYRVDLDALCAARRERERASEPDSDDPERLAVFLEGLAASTDDLAGAMERLSPPDELAALNRTAVAGLRAAARIYPEAAAEVRTDGADAAERHYPRLLDALDGLDELGRTAPAPSCVVRS
ncbi:MAG: hypothetical protein AB7V42_03020 [Thermoleophilia bacterium]